MGILFTIVFLISSALASDAEEFSAANVAAVQAAGTNDFAAALAVAERICTRKLARQTDCDATLVATREVDRAQREYEAAKVESARPAAVEPVRAELPVRATPVVATDEDEDADLVARLDRSLAPTPRPAPVVELAYDQETGIDYVASLSRPSAPWSGLAVDIWIRDTPDMTHVCVMKDGAPLPLGGDVPVSFSHQRGTDVFRCAVGRIGNGSTVYVPDGAVLYLLAFDANRQVYVVEEGRKCYKSKRAGRVETTGLNACPEIF